MLSVQEYLKWISNIAKLNKSMVFFTTKKFMPIFKKMRPQNLHNKTVFIGNHICHPKLTVEDFYTKYPEVKKNDEWTHVQFAVKNDVPYIISQY